MKMIDLRSDTVTMPTLKMREAVLNAQVGDDVYGDDPTVNELESLAAAIMGKEDAMFVPSGTMGNQLAIMTHTRRGDEIIVGFNAHIAIHEVGAAAILSGVTTRTIKNPNDIITLEDVVDNIRSSDIHEPPTSLLCLENARACGTVIDIKTMQDLFSTAKERSLHVHLDGARIFNAATYLGVDVREIARYSDTVMFCLSKGLCAPVGSMLCGPQEFISRARKNRKILGGGMRQAGILAACGIIAIREMTKRLNVDHENAKLLAQLLNGIGDISIDLDNVQINMVFFTVKKPGFSGDLFVDHMRKNNIKINGIESMSKQGPVIRLVTNNDVSSEDVKFAAGVIKNYFA
jgi:threonine aldolase